MTILEYKRYFKKELSTIYTESESAELFSIFVFKTVGFDRFQQRRFMHQHLQESHKEDLHHALTLLKTGKPFQQILGETEFYGMKFFVDEHVLIPRPETEELLELAIYQIEQNLPENESIKILDIGTGSGIIPIVLKKLFHKAELFGLDYSKEALETAQRNAQLHDVKIEWLHQNYLEWKPDRKYDIIISNPPYIGRDEVDEIADSVKEFEPKMALFSPTSDPLVFYRKIENDCTEHLTENGMVFLEINQKLGQETLELFKPILSEVKLVKDISGNERFVWGKK